MREILFRGKRLNHDIWEEGYYSPKDLLSYDGDPVDMPCIIRKEDLLWCRVEPNTVGQYTGLTDKNGKKIFEGDIVRHHNDNPYAIPTIFEKGEVYWDEQFYGWRRTSNGAFHRGVVDTYRMSHDCVYEVIGNIHDNPELLEVEHDTK